MSDHQPLARHNDASGEYVIYARYGGSILLTGNAPFPEFNRIEQAFRAAEQLAVTHAVQKVTRDIDNLMDRELERIRNEPR